MRKQITASKTCIYKRTSKNVYTCINEGIDCRVHVY